MKKVTQMRTRAYFLASSALLALPAMAQAQTGRPTDALDIAHSGPTLETTEETPMTVISLATTVEMPHTGPSLETTVETPEITINNNFTPTDARDPVNVNGIGQIVTDAGGGSVGLCTGTLINPRTVIFAAHCVNTRAATAYGANSGGVGIAIGFETNTRANAAGQPDELVNWLLGAGAGPGQFRTNTAQSLYNISQVYWNPASTAPASCTSATSCFLEADIAMAALDTPAANVPTWTMLFSPLNTPAAINPATGTGYHVTISGYGRFGTGTTGQNGGNDFRRRVAENMLGALTSINARNLFLFGTTGSPSRPQLLYWMDFDDPARGTATADTRDFNGFRDNALPREGLTGPGDSGGPLILDTFFSTRTILGVLSGGSTFFAGQPGGSYGTQSFYQPLFLYWDWIVANNPYRYATALAGNRNWEDAAAWVTTLDPAYQILVGNNIANGIPTELGGTNVATTPQFGELCFQSPLNTPAPPATNECQNLSTGAARNNVPNTPTGASDGAPVPTVSVTDAAEPDTVAIGSAQSSGWLGGSIESPEAAPGYRDGPVPAATIANGLPGATNFVPNNSDGVRTTGVSARYYDVNLRNAGTVTLNSAVTIDNLSISGASAGLNIATGASLTSLMRVNQLTGNMNVNGTLTSTGDYFFMTGLLSGSGRVNAPFLTSVLGTIAPGTIGTIGTLTVAGNLILTSGNQFLVDVGAGNTSDRIAVIAGTAAGSGTASIGGTVAFSPVSGHTIRAGDLYTILTAQNGVTGTFASGPLSAILRPQFVYSANTVQARIIAGDYQGVIANTPVQRSFAALLDRNRSGMTSSLSPVYAYLDLQNAATIQATLESWAPRAETTKGAIGTAAVENLNRFHRSRLASMDLDAGLGGSVAVIGNPLQTIARANRNNTAVGMDVTQLLSSYGGPADTPAKLPENMRAYLAGGYLDGENTSMVTAIPFGGKDNYDGYFVAAGIETELSENAGLGFSLSYTDIDGTTGGVAQTASGEMIQGTIYGKLEWPSGVTLDTQFGAAYLRAETSRNAVVGPTTYNLRSRDDVLALSGEVGLAKNFAAGSIDVGPRVAMRWSRIDFTPTVETGGGPALSFDRGSYDSVQGMAGLTLSGGMKIRPYASAYYVHEFEDQPAFFGANFVGGIGLLAPFALNTQDHDWFEASAGIAFGNEKFEIAIGADTTIERENISNQTYRGSVTIKF